jgi:hypothetical protein
MRWRKVHSEYARRAFTWCVASLYSVLALLGSEGLHAVLPHNCAAHSHVASHSHAHGHAHGHHHHHHHKHVAHSHSHHHAPGPAPLPAPCDPEDCLICKHSLTPVVMPVTVELIVADAFVAREGSRAPPRIETVAASVFLIRGPPTA